MPIAPAPTPWAFPHHSTWDPDDDLVALGADLDSGTLVTAYRLGLFPMPVTLQGEEQLGWAECANAMRWHGGSPGQAAT